MVDESYEVDDDYCGEDEQWTAKKLIHKGFISSNNDVD